MLDYYLIGQRIREYRKANNLSQDELAEKVNISVTHMSHIETGNTKLSLPVLVELAEALHVTTDSLLFNSQADQKEVVIREASGILKACTDWQLNVIVEIIKTAKFTMDQYR